MYNPDNEKLISWIKYIMVYSGFWSLPITKNRTLNKIYYIFSMFMRINYGLLWLNLVGELIRLISNNYDLAIIITSLSVVVNASKIMVKIIVFLKYNILGLFSSIIEKEQDIWQSESDEIKILYRKKIRLCKLYIIALASTSGVTVVLLEVTGAMGMFKLMEHNKANNDTLETHFMYQTLFPLDKYNNLKSFFVTQTIWSWTAFNYNVITHQIFVTFLVFAAAQLEVLQIRLRNYVDADFPEQATQEQINEKILVLKKLMRDHQYIVEFVQHFNKCTQYVILMEFVLSSLDMASVSTNLITSHNSVHLIIIWEIFFGLVFIPMYFQNMPYVRFGISISWEIWKLEIGLFVPRKIKLSEIGWILGFFVLLLVQLYLIGWNCNEIKIQSEAIADALYESRWYLLNKEARQLTQIMIARAQTPLLMTIGPFGPMTTRSVLMVLKAAYSYVSIMRQ